MARPRPPQPDTLSGTLSSISVLRNGRLILSSQGFSPPPRSISAISRFFLAITSAHVNPRRFGPGRVEERRCVNSTSTSSLSPSRVRPSSILRSRPQVTAPQNQLSFPVARLFPFQRKACQRSAANLLTKDEARWLSVKIRQAARTAAATPINNKKRTRVRTRSTRV